MKRFIGALALLALMGSAQATEVRVDFGFFDSAKEQGSKFVQALPKGTELSRLTLGSKQLELGSSWQVLHSGYYLDTVDEVGSPISGRGVATGYLYLGKFNAERLNEFMRLDISLYSRVRTEYLTNILPVCQKSEDYVYQDILEARNQRMSCLAVRVGSPALESKRSDIYSAVENAYGEMLFQADSQDSTKLYITELYETKSSNLFRLYRVMPAEGRALPQLSDELVRMRSNLQSAFF